MPSKIIKRESLRYRASVTVQGQTRQRLFPDTTRKSYREALEWENKVREDLEKELSQTNSEFLAVGDWVNDYLEDAQNRFVKSTLEEKKSVFTRFFEEEQISRELPIGELTLTQCRDFLSKQMRERSGYAANKDRKNLGAAWKWGSDNLEWWPGGLNPFLAVKKFPEQRHPRYVPPEEDFRKVYEISKGQDKVMLLTFLHLAARRSEVFRLTWADLDFNNKKVRLWTQKREDGHKEYDWLPLTSDLYETLKKWRQKRFGQPPVSENVFVCLNETAFCKSYYGKPFTVKQHFMKRLCDKAKVKHFGMHAIRHLTASILYQKGYPVSVIQAILRHKSPNTTARYLRSLGLEDTRKALEEGLKVLQNVVEFKQMVEDVQ